MKRKQGILRNRLEVERAEFNLSAERTDEAFYRQFLIGLIPTILSGTGVDLLYLVTDFRIVDDDVPMQDSDHTL